MSDELLHDLEMVLNDPNGRDRWRELGAQLIERERGSDDEEFENVRAHLQQCGAWRFFTATWALVERLFRDKSTQYGDRCDREKVEVFRELCGVVYPKLTVDRFLNEWGIIGRVVNRAGHKKFLPDGSWISNGVRFGA